MVRGRGMRRLVAIAAGGALAVALVAGGVTAGDYSDTCVSADKRYEGSPGALYRATDKQQTTKLTYAILEEQVLEERKIPVVPDILANAGGVIASMLEYSSSLSAIKPSQEGVYEVVRDKIGENFDLASERCASERVSLTQAAVEIAVERVYHVMKGRRML